MILVNPRASFAPDELADSIANRISGEWAELRVRKETIPGQIKFGLDLIAAEAGNDYSISASDCAIEAVA
jgi:hypothetical protein